MIIDSSVAVEVALGSQVGRDAIPMLAQDLFVPELFFAEFHYVLHRLRTRKAINNAQVDDARRVLAGLSVEALPVHHLEEALWRTAQRVSAYDAHYVVLAKELNVPLVTRDRRLANNENLGVKFVVID